jgi:hypothetical protein
LDIGKQICITYTKPEIDYYLLTAAAVRFSEGSLGLIIFCIANDMDEALTIGKLRHNVAPRHAAILGTCLVKPMFLNTVPQTQKRWHKKWHSTSELLPLVEFIQSSFSV